MIAGNLPGRTQTLSVAIYEAVQAGDDATANLLVLVTSVTCVVVLLLADGWCRCPAGVIRGTMSVAIQIRKRMVSGDRHFALDVDVTSRSKRIALFGPSGAGKSLTLRAVAACCGRMPDASTSTAARCSIRRKAYACRRSRAAWPICSRTTRCSRT